MNLEKGQNFKLANPNKTKVPPGRVSPPPDIIYTFYHLDGMYSYIVGEDNKIYHFAGWTEVEVC